MTNQLKKPSTISILFITCLLIILGLILFIIFRKPTIIVAPDNKIELIRDSITLLTVRIENEKIKSLRYKEIVDSLEGIPPKIKFIYNDQKKFVKSATVKQLDSIVRANAGLPPR